MKNQFINVFMESNDQITELLTSETQLKQAKEALRESEERYLSLVNNIYDIIYKLDRNGNITFINDYGLKLLGYRRDELLGQHFRRIIHPDDLEMTLQSFKKAVLTRKQKPRGLKFRIITKEKKVIWVLLNSSMTFDEKGWFLQELGVARVITGQKKTEESFRESEEKLRFLLENITDFIINVDHDHKILMINRCIPGLTVEQVIGTKVYNYVEPTHHEIMKKSLRKVFQTGMPQTYEVLGMGPKGPNTAWYETRVSPNKLDGKVTSATLISSDITKRKQAEDALLDANEKWISLTKNTDDIIMIIDSKGVIQYISKTIPPHTPKNTIGKIIYEYVPREQHNIMKESLRKVFKTGKTDSFENSSSIPKIGTLWFSTKVVPIKCDGKIISVILIVTDITERKKSEDALRKSEGRYRHLLESITDGVQVQDREFRYILVNDELARMAQMPKEKLMGNKMTDLFPGIEETVFFKTYKKVIETGEPGVASDEFVFKDGRRTWFEVHAYPAPEGILVIVTDITERRKSEEQIKSSLKEKEVLLREVHHRVKNNLQVITSLLKLQSQYIKNKRYSEMFKDSQTRIKSIALIHEKLYQSKDLAKVDFREYIWSLLNGLFRSYRASPGKIALKIKANDVSLGVDKAIPCGLIINELVSNSLKHAFPDGKEGEIKVALRSINKKDIELAVSDNGIGIQEDLDFRKTKSLGLHLVTILAEDQLHGEIRLNRNKGTKFRIKLRGMS